MVAEDFKLKPNFNIHQAIMVGLNTVIKVLMKERFFYLICRACGWKINWHEISGQYPDSIYSKIEKEGLLLVSLEFYEVEEGDHSEAALEVMCESGMNIEVKSSKKEKQHGNRHKKGKGKYPYSRKKEVYDQGSGRSTEGY